MTRKEQEPPKVSKAKSRIPIFQTIEEEAAFWDSHSSEEFAEELIPTENVKFVKAGSKKSFLAIASSPHLGYTTLYPRDIPWIQQQNNI